MLHVRDMRTDSCLGSLYQESVLMTNHYINRNNPGCPIRRTVRPIKMMVQIVKKKKTQRLQTPRQSWVGRLASLRPDVAAQQPDQANHDRICANQIGPRWLDPMVESCRRWLDSAVQPDLITQTKLVATIVDGRIRATTTGSGCAPPPPD